MKLVFVTICFKKKKEKFCCLKFLINKNNSNIIHLIECISYRNKSILLMNVCVCVLIKLKIKKHNQL